MASASPGREYYAVTLTGDENGNVCWSSPSQFVGTSQTTPRRELRAACPVDGQRLLKLWRDLHTPGLAVDSKEDLVIFLHLGGNAIIEESLARRYFPEIFEPRQFGPTGLCTKKPLSDIAPEILRRAPTPKLRMQVLKRDDYRCRICGRRAENDVDIELHVHHFRPWAEGGLTEEANLFTLCHTCHNGLDPHFEFSLANVFPESHRHFNELISNLDNVENQYVEGVRRYREIFKRKHYTTS